MDNFTSGTTSWLLCDDQSRYLNDLSFTGIHREYLAKVYSTTGSNVIRSCWCHICVISLLCAVYMFTHTGCLKTGPAQKQLLYACKSYSYRTRINVNFCHWNTCKLLFTITRTSIPKLVLVSMWMQLKSQKWRIVWCVFSDHCVRSAWHQLKSWKKRLSSLAAPFRNCRTKSHVKTATPVHWFVMFICRCVWNGMIRSPFKKTTSYHTFS